MLANISDANLIAERLLQNQQDIGDFVKPCIGTSKGNRLTTLLKEHILAAAGAIQAVKNGNQQAIDEAVDKVFQNSRQVSAFISDLNPRKLPFKEVLDHFNQHNQYVIDMTVARSKGEFAKDIKLFDEYYAQILEFSDFVLNGLVDKCCA